ncbi:MAG TPA: glycoside hydrolase family 127 protein [Lacipirellula sp.]
MPPSCRRMLLLVAAPHAIIAGVLYAPLRVDAAGIVDVSDSPHAVVRSVGLGDVHWTDGFWADRIATCRKQSIPSMWRLMESGQYKPFLGHFLIAAGEAEGDYHGAKWNDGDFYKWIEAACASLAVEPDAQLQAHVDRAVAAIIAAQREDGYLHTPVLVGQRNGDASAQPFSDRFAFEMYNIGHLMTAACLHHRVTGRDDLLQAACKTGDFLEETFRTPTPELARNSVCPSHYMALVELYRTTGDARYLGLVKQLFAMRHLVEEGGDDNQDRVPFAQQREAAGHAVRANYLYAGAADLYLETGDEELWNTLDAVWHNVVEKKLYITGGCGALYDGASPDGSPDQESITRVHQAYGRNYQLPHTTAHNETCANIGLVLWNWRMFLATGEARFLDVLELALYNSVLSGVSLDGDRYFYVNPLRNTDPLPTELRFSRARQPFFTSFCCPPNVVRTIAEVGGYAYSVSDGALWVNLYGGNKLDTKQGDEPLSIVQQSDYPWSGNVAIEIENWEGPAFELKLRIPSWASSAKIAVNGKQLEVAATPGSFASIKRNWQSGDRVELELPMPAQLIEAHPLVEEARNQVAVKRGPVVYCLESPGLPAGVKLAHVALPADGELTPRFDANLLGGVAAIDTKAIIRDGEPWRNDLYRPLSASSGRKAKITLTPYYAWANRGPEEMSVWLPVDR